MEYAGFWKRLGAYLVDVAIWLPLTGLFFLGNEVSRHFQLYYWILTLVLGFWLNVYLVQKYGGSPGKLLLKIKIARLDGSDVGYKEANLRYSVMFILSIISGLSPVLATLAMSDAEYFSMDWIGRARAVADNAPYWHNVVIWITNIWVWSEFGVMLTNKKRRAIHDFIAGTVVILKPAPNDTLNLNAARIAD